ncbi:hypothetical protein [Marinibacterium sp. SX1]|uniref:hypothetical protein n=1 Tax=Marinibacterium sp. SX1 TaxID=3388424 RepID=UPI003D168122
MSKLVAIVNVIAWAGFWAFGYLAVTAEGLSQGQIVVAVLLAAGGLVSGTWAWMRLVRHAEATGLARGSAMLGPEARARAQQHWEG